jgi:hypothetical protein
MIDDRLDPQPIRSTPREQCPIEAPRVQMPAGCATGWTSSNKNGSPPLRRTGHLGAVHRPLRANAPVTVPADVVIQVCPSVDELAAARRAARLGPLVGEPLRMQADWLVERTRKPARRRSAR